MATPSSVGRCAELTVDRNDVLVAPRHRCRRLLGDHGQALLGSGHQVGRGAHRQGAGAGGQQGRGVVGRQRDVGAAGSEVRGGQSDGAAGRMERRRHRRRRSGGMRMTHGILTFS